MINRFSKTVPGVEMSAVRLRAAEKALGTLLTGILVCDRFRRLFARNYTSLAYTLPPKS